MMEQSSKPQRVVRVDPDELPLRQAIYDARMRADRVGPLHALWDVISDAEALLAGKPTMLNYGDRASALKTLTEQLTGHP